MSTYQGGSNVPVTPTSQNGILSTQSLPTAQIHGINPQGQNTGRSGAPVMAPSQGAQLLNSGRGEHTSSQTNLLASNGQNQQNQPPQIVEERIKNPQGEVVSYRQYMKGKFLGKGGFAKCYEFVQCDTKQVTAAKIIQKSSLQRSRAKQKLMSEIKIHRSVKHVNVAQFMHFFEDTENVYILLELCQNQSMNELLKRRKRLHEIEVKCYTHQIINALKYLHSHRIIHRDLKLGNLFINDKMQIKLGDFGLATKLDFDGEKKRTICGTPNYIAPEVLEGRAGHSYEVDIWSLGVIIYTLIIGKPPFETTDVKATYNRIKRNQYSFPDHVPISEEARDLVSRILTGDPAARPTLDQICIHPFMTNVQFPKLLPQSFLAVPPSAQFLRQFVAGPALNYQSASSLPRRLDGSNNSENIRNGANLNSGQRPVTSGNPPQVFSDRAGQAYVRQGSSGNNAEQVKPGQPSKMPQIVDQRLAMQQKQPADQQASHQKQSQVPPISIRSVSQKDIGGQSQKGTSARQQTAGQPVPNKIGSDVLIRPQTSGQSPVASSQIGALTTNAQELQIQTTQVWVTKWVDYSSKYGLGYLLSDMSAGVFFNDSTKIVAESSGNQFFYYERKAIAANEKQDVMSQFNFTNYPTELQKKVTLLQHFKSYLEQNYDAQEKEQLLARNQQQAGQKLQYPPGSVYVKKWMRTKHAIMFRLSNKIVQVNFQDHTEILLNSENRYVTYVNKKGDRQTMPLNQALDSNNAEMTKRLKYTKDILTHMLNNNQQQNPINLANPGIGAVSTRSGLASQNPGTVSGQIPTVEGIQTANQSQSSRRLVPAQLDQQMGLSSAGSNYAQPMNSVQTPVGFMSTGQKKKISMGTRGNHQ